MIGRNGLILGAATAGSGVRALGGSNQRFDVKSSDIEQIDQAGSTRERAVGATMRGLNVLHIVSQADPVPWLFGQPA